LTKRQLKLSPTNCFLFSSRKEIGRDEKEARNTQNQPNWNQSTDRQKRREKNIKET